MKRQYIFLLRTSHDIPPKYVVDAFLENENYDKSIGPDDIVAAQDLCGITIGKDISKAVFAMQMRYKFNSDMIQNLLAVIVENTTLTPDNLENIIQNMSPERLRDFIEGAKVT